MTGDVGAFMPVSISIAASVPGSSPNLIYWATSTRNEVVQNWCTVLS